MFSLISQSFYSRPCASSNRHKHTPQAGGAPPECLLRCIDEKYPLALGTSSGRFSQIQKCFGLVPYTIILSSHAGLQQFLSPRRRRALNLRKKGVTRRVEAASERNIFQQICHGKQLSHQRACRSKKRWYLEAGGQ